MSYFSLFFLSVNSLNILFLLARNFYTNVTVNKLPFIMKIVGYTYETADFVCEYSHENIDIIKIQDF